MKDERVLSLFIFHLSFLSLSSPQPRPALARVEAVAVKDAVAAGEPITLVVRVTPRAGIHVYSPAETRYKPVVLTIDRTDSISVEKALFPESSWRIFEGERVRVYDAAFEIRQPVRVTAPAGGSVPVRGTLEYQACDDLMCYLPVKVPLRWNVPVR